MKYLIHITTAIFFLLAACESTANHTEKAMEEKKPMAQTVSDLEAGLNLDELSIATFAGGCFWCTEAQFERIRGVDNVVSGYAGGKKKNPTYKEVSAGKTKYAEAVQIYYDPKVITYEELLEIFFVGHDPTQLNRQGPDVGAQYRTEIYYRTEEEKSAAEAMIKKLDESGKYERPIVTKVTPFTTFYLAEDYHQDFYELNPRQSYVYNVSRPKVEKVMKVFKDKLKPQYQ